VSTQTQIRRKSVTQILGAKGGTPLVVLTAYTAPIARLLDPHCDILLVGDSLGMVVYGMESTVGVTTEMMIAHGRAVVRSSAQSMVVVDLPFGTYQESPEQAFRTAARVMAETGCTAVKLEGGAEMAETVAFLTRRGVPVMGHVGLLPQSVNTQGGYGARGKTDADYAKILDDSRAIAEAGAFSMVVEGTVEALARQITEAVAIPTIGIGGSPACDGQVLVVDDMIGLFAGFTPKFVRRYAEIGKDIDAAAAAYAADVRERRFPGPEHLFGTKRPAAPEKKAS